MTKMQSAPRLYLHDRRVAGFIVSTACIGPACEICAHNPFAAKRANNKHFPWPPEETEKNDQEQGR